MAHPGSNLGRERATNLDVPNDHPIEVMHHVEIAPVDRVVLTQANHTRNRYCTVAQSMHEPVLARHVMGAGQQRSHGWTAQHVLATDRAGYRVGHV